MCSTLSLSLSAEKRRARARVSVLFPRVPLPPLARSSPTASACPLTPRDVHSLKPGGDRVRSQFYRGGSDRGGGGSAFASFPAFRTSFLASNSLWIRVLLGNRSRSVLAREANSSRGVCSSRRCRGKMSRRRCRLSTKPIEKSPVSSYASSDAS